MPEACLSGARNTESIAVDLDLAGAIRFHVPKQLAILLCLGKAFGHQQEKCCLAQLWRLFGIGLEIGNGLVEIACCYGYVGQRFVVACQGKRSFAVDCYIIEGRCQAGAVIGNGGDAIGKEATADFALCGGVSGWAGS